MKQNKPAPFPTPRPLPELSEALQAQGIALPAARIADLPLLADIYAASRVGDLLFAPWTAQQKRAFLDEQFALQHAHFVGAHRRGDFRLVTRGDTAIGRFYFDRSGDQWSLVDILLAPKVQGSGIGGALIAWLLAAAAEAGATGVRLSVAHNNPRAQTLYRRLGFEDAGDVAGTHLSMVWRPIRP